jgi:hypothetical protein
MVNDRLTYGFQERHLASISSTASHLSSLPHTTCSNRSHAHTLFASTPKTTFSYINTLLDPPPWRMHPNSQNSGIHLFLQQLQTNPADITAWSPFLRMSLHRGRLTDLIIYGHRVVSVPRFALMAVFPSVLTYWVKCPRMPAVEFTFDISVKKR